MGYRHFGRIGDIWKHLPLCDVLTLEKITSYIETNAAYFEYQLSHTSEQNYGIGHFIREASKYPELQQSKYYQLLKPYYDNDIYIGSCAQAIELLKTDAERFVFFDLDPEAIASLKASIQQIELEQKVELRMEDSISGLINMIPQLDSNTFLHIDPYLIHEPNVDGYSYLDVFVEASKQGVKCFLWYGFMTLHQKRQIDILISEAIEKAGITGTTCNDLIMKEIREDQVIINPGILGCGVLTSNLTSESKDVISQYAQLLVKAYANATYEGHKGALYC